MSISHPIQLDGKPGSPNKKHDCPGCGQKKRFRRYFNYETGEYLSDDCGLCDRPRCGYHFTPKQYFEQHPEAKNLKKLEIRAYIEPPQPKPLIHLPKELLLKTLVNYDKNSFIKALLPLFTVDAITLAIEDYFIGTIEAGLPEEGEALSTVFWFIDQGQNIRAGQVKVFDSDCHTMPLQIGEQTLKAWWIHSLLKRMYKRQGKEGPQWLKNYSQGEKVTCLYGEHLLSKYPNKKVALVESPKSAIIGSMVYPHLVWLATNALKYFTADRCKALKGKEVYLFPDTGLPDTKTGKTPFDLWKERAEELKDLANFHIEDVLEANTSPEEKGGGFDIADYILRQQRAQKLAISVDDIDSMPVKTITGRDFSGMILQTFKLKDGSYIDILFDSNGEPVLDESKAQIIAGYFNKDFKPGALDNMPCLINIVKE